MIILRTKKFDSGEIPMSTIPGGEQAQLTAARQGLMEVKNYHQRNKTPIGSNTQQSN